MATLRSYETVNFSEALRLLKLGRTLRREIWKDEMSFVYLVGTSVQYTNDLTRDTTFNVSAYIARIADGVITPWIPGFNDLLANDWKDITQ